MAATTLPALPAKTQSALPAKTLPILLAFTCCLAACSPHLAPPGRYQSSPVTADGIPDEWSLPLRFANPANTLQYDVTNDTKNIYVCALSRDETTIIRMLRSGITVYFDPDGKNGRDISLHYPLRKQPDLNIRNYNDQPADHNGEPLTSRNDSGFLQELLLESDSYGVTGFSGIDNGPIAVTDTKSPIRVAVKLTRHDSLLVYEAIVPIVNVLGAGANPGRRNPKKPFSVGIVLNTPSGQSAVQTHHHSGGHGLDLGMNGMHMGSGGGGRRNTGNSNDDPPIREDASWYQFRLAAGQ